MSNSVDHRPISGLVWATLRLCLVQWILGRKKKGWENENVKLFGEYLAGREREGKEMMGPGCFLFKMGRKLRRENEASGGTKMPMRKCTWVLSTPSCFFFFFFIPLHIHKFFLVKKMCYLFVCTYTILLLKKCAIFFYLFNRDIIINLYQLHFFIILFFFSTK